MHPHGENVHTTCRCMFCFAVRYAVRCAVHYVVRYAVRYAVHYAVIDVARNAGIIPP